MSVAETIGRRSRCIRRQIGAVIVSKDNAYLVAGYSGPPGGLDLPVDTTCQSYCPRGFRADLALSKDYGDCVSVHAEANAVARADWSRIQGGTLYSSSSLCWDCGKLVANCGVSTVVMTLDPVRDAHRKPEETIAFMERCGLDVIVL